MAKAIKPTRETELYEPMKTFLEKQGYEVKGEIREADVVGVRGDEEPLIVELKTGFSLSLFHQAIERQSVCDCIYVAVPRGSGRPFTKALASNKALCRRLGLGLITVRLKDGHVEVHVDPAPYKPRQSKLKKQRLLREFARRTGDPAKGGAMRSGLMTAYRQDALRCLQQLFADGPSKGAIVAKTTGVEKARTIMSDNHYGWFERVSTGIYGMTDAGQSALKTYENELSRLSAVNDPVDGGVDQ